MKHKIRFAAALIAAALMCGASSVAAVLTGSDQGSAIPTGEADDTYTVSEYDGDVGVYRDGELIFTAGINTSGLRETDRRLLMNGIETGSYEDVLRLLEDLSS